jgi:hypothetical protein
MEIEGKLERREFKAPMVERLGEGPEIGLMRWRPIGLPMNDSERVSEFEEVSVAVMVESNREEIRQERGEREMETVGRVEKIEKPEKMGFWYKTMAEVEATVRLFDRSTKKETVGLQGNELELIRAEKGSKSERRQDKFEPEKTELETKKNNGIAVINKSVLKSEQKGVEEVETGNERAVIREDLRVTGKDDVEKISEIKERLEPVVVWFRKSNELEKTEETEEKVADEKEIPIWEGPDYEAVEVPELEIGNWMKTMVDLDLRIPVWPGLETIKNGGELVKGFYEEGDWLMFEWNERLVRAVVLFLNIMLSNNWKQGRGLNRGDEAVVYQRVMI